MFGVGILVDDIRVERQGDDIVLIHANGSDSITIQAGFSLEHGWHGQIVFADGSVWLGAELAQKLLEVQTGGDDDDLLLGSGQSDLLDGGAGNDTLIGNGGEDTLLGGAGDDQLQGGVSGHTTMEGGAGDDVLIGNKGRETFVFGVGDGRDLINYGSQVGKIAALSANDEIRFKAGISARTSACCAPAMICCCSTSTARTASASRTAWSTRPAGPAWCCSPTAQNGAHPNS